MLVFLRVLSVIKSEEDFMRKSLRGSASGYHKQQVHLKSTDSTSTENCTILLEPYVKPVPHEWYT